MATSKSLCKHIVLATDLSKKSSQVAKRAVAIAKTTRAKLSVVHVFAHTPIAYAGEFSIPIDVEFELTLKKQAEKQLKQFGKKHGIPAKMLHVLEGSVKVAVTDFAKKHKADLIVVGTHSHEGLGVLLGSQANAILHAAECDVWVIKIK